MLRLALVFVCAAVLIAANGTCDEKPPQLDYLDVNFDSEDRYLNVRFRGLDNFTGLATVGFRWRQTNGTDSVWCGHSLPLDHNPSDTVAFRCRVYDKAQWTYTLLAASVVDRVGNTLVYGEASTDAGFDEPNVPLGRRPASFGGGNYNFTVPPFTVRETAVVQYTLSAVEIDVSNASAMVLVEMEADTPANFSSALIQFSAGPGNDDPTNWVSLTPANFLNGTLTRGWFSTNFTFHQHEPQANYTLSMIQVYDTRGNMRWYARGAGLGPESIVVRSNTPDRVAPVIWKFELNPQVVNSTLTEHVITATIGLSDDLSGIWAFAARFCRASAPNIPIPVNCLPLSTLVPVRNRLVDITDQNPRTGDRLNGTWYVEIAIPKSTPTGLYGLSLDGLWAWDRAGNRQQLPNNAELRRRFANATSFAVVCGGDRVPVNPPASPRNYTVWIILGSVVGFLLFVFLARIICCGGGSSANSLNEDSRNERLLA